MRYARVLLTAMIAGCYAPTPTPGAPCGDGTACPSGLVCSAATGTCELSNTPSDFDAASDSTAPDSPTVDAALPDAAIDGAPSADASFCYGGGLIQVCFGAAPTGTLTIDQKIDTDGASCMVVTQPFGPAACVFAAGTISVTSSVRVTGSRPLVLVAADTLSVLGVLDVASHRVSNGNDDRGPGANASACTAGTTAANGAGGPGGSFEGRGGTGGSGTTPTAPGPVVVSLAVVRGGCAGGAGNGPNAGDGAAGGGAVALIAGTAIQVAGRINASGAGGHRGVLNPGGGGGGGGSGGLISLDAPTIAVSGMVFANGGGGAEGAGTSNSGTDGGESGTPSNAGSGGGGNAGAGDGGSGSVGLTLDGQPGESSHDNYSGGGGGGAGFIYVHGATSGFDLSRVSPPPKTI